MRRFLSGLCLAACFSLVSSSSCYDPETARPETGLEALSVMSVAPGVAVPGTQLVIKGRSFLDQPFGISWLRLQGMYAGQPVDAYLPATFQDYETMTVTMTPDVIGLLGGPEGTFEGAASIVVDYTPDGTRFASMPVVAVIAVQQHLQPQIDELQDGGDIFVNDAIPITGSGYLLGGDEGRTVATVEGCFQVDTGGECQAVAPVDIELLPQEALSREQGSFAFLPAVAGILPGSFTGTVSLRNEHADGTVTQSDAAEVFYTLLPTRIDAVGEIGSLGAFVDVQGGGFIAGDDAITFLRIDGTYAPAGSSEGAPVEGIEILGDVESGRLLRYVVNEEDQLAQSLEAAGGIRYADGLFEGTITPIVQFREQELIGEPAFFSFRLRPVKQVVQVVFNPSYVESLREFGMRALDSQIRERILQVLERDYESINIEFRTEPPEDYSLYSVIEISGSDPNGLGLLGYDNSHGKDTNNERLFDRIGGVNALTQEDGFPGFGGVFIESLFTFSSHPPAGIASEVSAPMFDQIFDPFRPDSGTPVSSADVAGGAIPLRENGDGCPATERREQIACAVWVLGSIIGTTTSHEVGHSLGLADPLGSEFHNRGDGRNRLMDKGGLRSFEERAELKGEGPSRFCTQEYDYLRRILPTDEPPTEITRPSC